MSQFKDLIKSEAYNYQHRAFVFSRRKPQSALLMEQGTGKTLVAIGVAGYRFVKRKINKLIIVTPKTVMGEWERQFEEHANFSHEVIIVDGKTKDRQRILKRGKDLQGFQKLYVFIMTYETMRILTPEIISLSADMIILDESQKIKNRTAKQSKAAHKLSRYIKYRMILTGTPITESPLDFWSQFKFLKDDVFPQRYADFQQRYAIMGGYGGYIPIRFKNLKELSIKAHSISYRITKKEALDLPPTVDQDLKVYLSNKELNFYNDMKKEFVVEFGEEDSISAPLVVTQIMRLQQLASGFITDGEKVVKETGNSKLESLRELLEDLPRSEKVVVFARFLYEVERIKKLCDKLRIPYVTLTGATTNRQNVINQFQKGGKTRVIIAQIETAGLGITLTSASYCVFYSISYSYASYYQARARVHRIGQENKVTYIHLLSQGTVDESILRVVRRKGKLAELVTDILGKPKIVSGTEKIDDAKGLDKRQQIL